MLEKTKKDVKKKQKISDDFFLNEETDESEDSF